jgi:hypothetical protein
MRNNKVNICYWDNKGGLTLDAEIVSTTLKNNGFKVFHNGFSKDFVSQYPKVRRFCWQLQKVCLLFLSKIGIRRFSVAIHLETLTKSNLQVASKDLMIANLEWLSADSFELLSAVDMFLCKTLSAQRFFDQMELQAVYTSFTTISPYDGESQQKPDTFVHIAGKSGSKGTQPLIKLWAEHPEWPRLTVVVSRKHYVESIIRPSFKEFESDNLYIIEEYISASELKRLQNEAEIHLCLSEAEGFGHSICEPMSAGAIVVTVDGYPMNELVTPHRGVLVKSHNQQPMRHGMQFFFDHDDFEIKIETLLNTSAQERQIIKNNARRWFYENDIYFKNSLVNAVNGSLSELS